jgi:chromosome segregation ATPase
MVPPTPTPSPRLLRAAQAEREQLARHRRELVRARESLRAELDRIETSLQEVDEREALLDRLAGPAPGQRVPDGEEEGLARRASRHEVDVDAKLLRGPAIRREAVRVLLAHPDRPEALHYREWFALLHEAGFRVAGKDPLATFLTQLSRSPAVRKSTQAGVYELDRAALARLRRRQDQLRDELRTLTAAPGADADLATVRARRTELNAELGRVEKAVEEVEGLFARDHDIRSTLLAATA